MQPLYNFHKVSELDKLLAGKVYKLGKALMQCLELIQFWSNNHMAALTL